MVRVGFRIYRMDGDMSENSSWNGRIWMHGASLGESRMLLQLAKRFREPVLLTTHRSSNVEALNKDIADDFIHVQKAPWPLKMSLTSQWKQGKPRLAVFAENEIWPGWISACRKHQVPVHIVSAVFSEKALHRWKWIPASLRNHIQSGIQEVHCQNTQEALRWLQWGYTGALRVGGDWKWLGMQTIHEIPTDDQWEQRPVDLLLVSIRKEDWPKLAEGLEKLQEFGSRMVLIPRYPHEASWFQSKTKALKLQIPVVDIYGQVLDWLNQSKLVVMGGGFGGRQTHNYREALLHCVPVIVGPHGGVLEPEIQQLQKLGVVGRLSDLADLCIGRDGFDCFLPGFFPWVAKNAIPQAVESFRHPVKIAVQEWIREAGLQSCAEIGIFAP